VVLVVWRGDLDHQSGGRFGGGGGGGGVVVRRFRYGADPLCVAACVLYVAQRWVFDIEVLRGWFTDVLFLPAGVPWFLWFERAVGLRRHDGHPSVCEVAWLLAVWSVAAEVVGPMVARGATADPMDVVWYAAGAAGAALWWRRAGGQEAGVSRA
jgi:hypothetical protein